MSLWRTIVAWLGKYPGAVSDPPVVTPEEEKAMCPLPLSSDDGTKADCQAKRHCGCEEQK